MKVGYRKLGPALAAATVLVLALSPASAQAQSDRYTPMFWSFEGGAGMASPMGDLADMTESGPSFTVGASYFVSPRIAIRAEGAVDLLPTKLPEGFTGDDPDFQMWHMTGGIEFHVVDPMGSTTVAVDLGLGASTLDSDPFLVQDYPMPDIRTIGLLNGSFLAANAGAKVGFNFARHAESGVPLVTLFAQADLRVVWSRAESTAVYTALNDLPGLSTMMVVPLSAGMRINLP